LTVRDSFTVQGGGAMPYKQFLEGRLGAFFRGGGEREERREERRDFLMYIQK
jgi:hypothetical protein